MHTMYTKLKFHKLFLSYFLVFLIPTILISVIVFSISNHILKEQIQTNNKLTTQTGQYNLHKTFESFNIVGTSIAYSNFGHSIDLTHENTAASQLISYLNRSKLSYSFIQDIFLVYKEGDYIYSSTSSFTRDNFYNYLNLPHYTSRQLDTLLSELTKPLILTVRQLKDSTVKFAQTKDYLLYLIPCTRIDYTIGSLGFLIDIDLLNKFLGNINLDSYTYLIDQNNEILNPNNEYTNELSSFLLETPSDVFRDKDVLSISEANEHTFIAGTIIPNLLNLVNISSNKTALHSLIVFRNLTFSILLIAFILGIICVIIACKRHYRNWLKMTSSYEDELKKTLPLKQKEVLRTLIEGSYMYPSDFDIQCEECGLSFKGNYHYCILMLAKNEPLDLDTFLSHCLGSSIPYTYKHCLEQTKEKSIYLIGTDAQLRFDSQYYDTLVGTLFMSKPVHNILEIKLQYTDLMSSMYMESFSKTQDKFLEPSIYTERLHYYEDCLTQINTYLSTSDIEPLRLLQQEFAQAIHTDFIALQMKIRITLQLYILFSNVTKVTFDIEHLIKAGSVTELEHYINLLFNTYISCTHAKKEADTINLNVETIKTFIQEHYTDPLFSLQLIADHHHVSNSYLSWFFKQKTGITVLDYTTKLKMELATQLLQEDRNLQDIALQVGYVNVSSFIRRFKQTMGMTPGEYKKNLRS